MIIPGNKYINPYQSILYAQSSNGSLARYIPFNGFLQAPYIPSSGKSGSFIVFTVASAPADLSFLNVLDNNSGQSYSFQFVRAGSVPTAGIPVAVPAGGGTAAQTTAALLAALAAGSGVYTDTGKTYFFPFGAVSIDATHLRLEYRTPGPQQAPGGTQATISFAVTSLPVNYASCVPGRVGGLSTALGA